MISDTKSNLEAAAAGENMEWTVLYADAAKVAKEEGFPEIARSFEQIAKVEMFHEKRYRRLAANIANGEVFKKKPSRNGIALTAGIFLKETKHPKNVRPASIRRRFMKSWPKITNRTVYVSLVSRQPVKFHAGCFFIL